MPNLPTGFKVVQEGTKLPQGFKIIKGVESPEVIGGPTTLNQPAIMSDNRYTQDPLLEPFRDLAAETTAGQAFGASMGRGASKILRGLGIMDPESQTEKSAFKALAEEHPKSTFTGGIVGEAAPFATVPIGAIPSTVGRVATAFGVGALEGGLIKKGEGKDVGEQISSAGIGGTIAGGIEAGVPIVGRIGGALFRKITGRTPRSSLITPKGNPTPEFTDALEAADLNFADFTEATQSLISRQKKGAAPDQVAKIAEFEELGIPYTTGDITKDFAQQAKEERLVQSAADVAGEELRALRLKQSEVISGSLDDIVKKSGVPEDVGSNIKKALTGRKSLLKNKKNALYKKAAKTAGDVGEIPFPVDNIQLAMPDKATLKRLGRIKGSQVEAAEDLLIEFGIDNSKEALDIANKKGISVQPLNLKNFEDFRMALNQISKADQTGATQVMTGALKDALDNEAENIGSIFKEAGASEDVLKTLVEARKTVRKLKTEFSPDAITGKIINTKRDGFTEVMEASQIFKNVVGVNKPNEFLERTIKSLEKSGDKGRKALGSIQAATVMDLIEEGFKAQSRRIEGSPVFGVIPFVKKYNAIGEDKLKIIFRGNEEGLKRLKRVKNIADGLIPDSGAVPKGSASVNLDALISVLKYIPGSNILKGTMGTLADPIMKRATSSKALKGSPEILKNVSPDAIDIFTREYPSIAASLGIAGVVNDNKKKE